MMLRFLIPLLFLLSTVNSIADISTYSPNVSPSVASSSQIRFAIENQYDDTGPGAKKPEYAYNTYKNIEDALVAYLDDPDTKLPESEKQKAVQKLLSKSQVLNKPELPAYNLKKTNFNNLLPSAHFPYQIPFNYPTSEVFFSDGNNGDLREKYLENHFVSNPQQKNIEAFRLQKFHTVKGNPLSLAHYTRGFDEVGPGYYPKSPINLYNNADTQHSAATKYAGVVHGYYTFVDSDGKYRTVHYSGDDTQTINHDTPSILPIRQ